LNSLPPEPGHVAWIVRPKTYAYDAAHRLTQITNAASDKLVYTLDLMGNRTKEEVFDAGNTVVQRKNRVFDSLSRHTQCRRDCPIWQ
jgi:YD repeat-containing protein